MPEDDIETWPLLRDAGRHNQVIALFAQTENALDARYQDGVLTLRLPVAEKAKPRRVPISVGDGGPTAIDTSSEELVGSSS